MEPRRRHFASVVRVASQCRGGKVPLSGQASISLSMAFEPSATIHVGGKVPIPCQFAATDNNDNAHLPGAIPQFFDLPASLLEAVRLPMVACTVSYAYSNGYVVDLCSCLSDSNCLRGSLGKSKCIQVIWRGIFPKLSWPECSSVTFHYEKLDEFIGRWAEWERCVTIGSVVRNDVMEGADGGRCPPLFVGWGE